MVSLRGTVVACISLLCSIGCGGPAGGGDTPMIVQAPPEPQGPPVEMYGISFLGRGCERAGKGVSCTVAFTNLEVKDRELAIHGYYCGGSKSELVDDTGNAYQTYINVDGNETTPALYASETVPAWGAHQRAVCREGG